MPQVLPHDLDPISAGAASYYRLCDVELSDLEGSTELPIEGDNSVNQYRIGTCEDASTSFEVLRTEKY